MMMVLLLVLLIRWLLCVLLGLMRLVRQPAREVMMRGRGRVGFTVDETESVTTRVGRG